IAAVFERVGIERADLVVTATRRNRVTASWIRRLLPRQRTAVRLPLVAAAIEDLALLVPEELERPVRVAGPPVGLVAIEDHRRGRLDTVATRSEEHTSELQSRENLV